MSEAPAACRDCIKTEAQVDMCRIRIYQFSVFGKKCPREKPVEPLEAARGEGERKVAARGPSKDVLTVNLQLTELETDVFSPRKSFSQRYVDELAEDIEREGQLKPIIVRLHPSKSDVYQLIDGEHRVRAFRKLGRSLIRAEVRVLGDEEADFLAMRINQMHGKRLEDLEEGLHIKKMMEQHGWSQRDIAERLRRSQQWVSQRLKLVRDTSEQLLDAFTTRVVNLSKAREIAELPKEDQPAVVERVIKEGLSFKNTETLVHAIKSQPESKAEILAKPINELTPPPKEVQEFEEEHGPEQPKFETGRCPNCGAEYVINWVLTRINWKEAT